MSKKKLLVCDVDGTLINSNAGFSMAVSELLAKEFAKHVNTEEITHLASLPLREIIERFTGPIDTGKYHAAAKIYRDIYNSKYIHQIALFPGVKETLAELSKYCFLSTATNLPNKRKRTEIA